MQLVAQDYGEILAALKAATDTKGHERRTTARMEVQAQVKLLPYCDGTTGKPFTCLTRDLSFKGIGLLQCKQSPRGSQFVIELPRRNAEAPLTLLCTVMYCRELAEGLYNVGASFNAVYDPDAPVTRGSSGASGVSELDRIRQSILG
jgi:hypothetical protein